MLKRIVNSNFFLTYIAPPVLLLSAGLMVWLISSTIVAHEAEAAMLIARPSFIGISQSDGYMSRHTIAVLDSVGNVWITQENTITGKWSEWVQLKSIPLPKEVQ